MKHLDLVLKYIFLQENKITFHEIFHEWFSLDLYDHPCVISQPWQPDKDTNNTANSKLQMVIDCLDVLCDSMPLEVTFVYSPNFRKCWKCIKEYWPIDEVFRVQTVTLDTSLLWSLWSQKTVIWIVTNFLFSCVFGLFHITFWNSFSKQTLFTALLQCTLYCCKMLTHTQKSLFLSSKITQTKINP